MRKMWLIVFLALSATVAAQPGVCRLTMPVHEHFDSYGTGSEAVPACWFATRNYDVGYAPHLDGSRHYSGTASMVLYPGTLAESHYSMIIAPEIDSIQSFEGLFLRFQLMAASTAARLEVGVCEDTNRYSRAFVALDTLHADQGNRWQEAVVDLGRYSGAGRRLAFRMQRSLQPTTDECWIDDVTVERCGTTTPWVNHVGSTTATLNFEPFGFGIIEVSWGDSVISPATSPLTLTGLTPDSDYVFSIGCAGADAVSLTVHTMESAGMTIAYYENFDAVDSVVPRYWRRPTTNRPQVVGGTLRMMPATGDSCMAVLPLPADVSLNELHMAFTLTGTADVQLVVGGIEYADEPESFIAIDTVVPDGTQQIVSLAPYTGNGLYPALLAIGNGTLTVDELRLARCMTGNVHVYNLTESNVTLTWDTLVLADGATVQIEYGTTGFAVGSGTLITADHQPYTLDNLTADHGYDLYLRPSCGDLPASCDKHSFRTFAHEMTVPYCTGFEDGTLPQGWVTNGSATLTDAAYAGVAALHIAAGSTVTLPLLGDDIQDSLYIEFYGIGGGQMVVGYMATPYAPFIATDTLTGNNSWSRYTVAVHGGGQRCLALQPTAAWTIDALALRNGSVGNVTVNSVEQTSAHVAWTLLGGDSVRIEYAAVSSESDDFASGSGTTVVIDSALTLTGLAAGTHYCMHISPYDSADDGSCHHLTVHFTTLPAPVELPYCQNFDAIAIGGYSANWRRLSDYGEYPLVSGDRNRSGGRSLRMSVFGDGSTVAILPDIESCTPHATIAFWANATVNSQHAKLLVGTIADATDATTFTALDTIGFASSETWIRHMTRIANTGQHIAIMLRGASTGETRVYVEDLCIEPCVATDIRVGNIDSTSATVSWESVDSLVIVCHTSNGQVDTLRNSPDTIDGLTTGTTYTFTFRALCSCGVNGLVLRPGEGSPGSTANGGRASITINTQASPTRIPYCNSFEGITGTTPNSWRYNGSMSITDRNYHNGYHSLQATGGSTMIMPPMNDVNTAVLSMYVYGTAAVLTGSNGIVVGIMNHPDSASTFDTVGTLRLSALGVWQHLVADLSEYSGGGRYIALRPVAGGGTLFIDDLMVSSCCISDASVTDNGLLAWRTWHGVDSVIIEYGPAGFQTGDGLTDTIVCTAESLQSHQLAYFDSTASYDIYLRPVCDSGDNCQQLTLQTGNSTTTPYCQNFDDVPSAGMPAGWIVSRTYGSTPAMTTLGNNQRLDMKAAVNNRSITALPELAVDDISRHQIAFSLRTSNHNRARLIVGQMTDATNPNTFSPRDTVTLTASNRWQSIRLPLSHMTGSDRLALACDAIVQSAEVWVDSIAVTEGLTPDIAAVSARGVKLTNSDTDYYVEYGPSGFMQGEGTTIHITDGIAYIYNLLPQQTYWFYCRHGADEYTCLAPVAVTMPDEESLPYCHRRDTIATLALPEFEVDSMTWLNLYFTLRGGTPVEVGVMEQQSDWNSFIPIDTVEAPSGTWQPVHVSLATYSGNGRFVTLRTVSGANAIIDGLTVTSCELPSLTVNDDNTATLTGTGAFEYGITGFTPGSGTLTTSPAVVALADTTTYDFYALCTIDAATCQAPKQVSTSLAATLPYCSDFADGLPAGWTIFSDAVNANAVSTTGGRLTMTVSGDQTVGVKLPSLPSGTWHFTFDMSGTAALLLCGDTVSGNGQKHVAVTSPTTRPVMQAIGNGTLYIDNLMVESCTLPDSLAISQPGNGRVQMSWDESACGSFYIEYTLAGLQQGQGTTLLATSSPVVLTLDPDTTYNIYLRCDSAALTCRKPQQLTTLASMTPVPYCTNFEDETQGDKPAGWRILTTGNNNNAQVTTSSAHLGNHKLTITNYYGTTYMVLPQPLTDSLRRLTISFYARFRNSNGHSLTLGTMSDAANPTTFDSLTSFTSMRTNYKRCFHALTNYYGNGQFIALRVSDDDILDIDDVLVNDCAAYNFRMTERESDYVELEWEQQGNPEIEIAYGPRGFDTSSGITIHPTASPCRIAGLSPLTSYVFYATSHCANSTASCTLEQIVDTFYTFTPQGGSGCIDYTDLNASYVTCSYGPYQSPTENIGAIDYGYQSALSRHTVHFDTAERDARTQGLLRTIPVGEQASVRLGNWTSGGNSTPQAESITYGMTVNAADADLLVLSYAAVLQDPEHAASLQPRFKLEILDQEGILIDSCGMSDFIANANLDWAQAPNEVLWKDWTTVGVDLNHYDGQTIFVRLTTYDCGEGSHFGYAYFTLRCAQKRMQSEGCSNVPDNRFTVPSGFSYRWYSSNDTTATISDSASIWVRSDNSVTYYCQLSFVDNPSCSFTMSAFAGARYPLALFDTTLTIANCEFDLQLTNRSTISGDGVTPLGTDEPCETARWLLPGGQTSTAAAPTIHMTDTGAVSVSLIVGIANDLCIDTLTREIQILYPYPAAITTGRTMRCDGDDADTISVDHAVSYSWADGSNTSIVLAPPADTVFTCYTVDTNGCLDTLHHSFAVHPVYAFHDTDSVCSSTHTYAWRDTTLSFATGDTAVAATLPRHSIYGCDSIMTIALHLHTDYYPVNYDSVCNGTTVTFFDTSLTTSGTYQNIGNTVHGCDSLTTLHFTVMPTWDLEDRQIVCDSLRWINGQLYLADTSGIVDTLATAFGCDSLMTLLLTVYDTKRDIGVDTFCEGSQYLFRNHYCPTSGYYADTLTTIGGCDSILGINLTALPLPRVSIETSALCDEHGYRLLVDSDVPYLWWFSNPDDPRLNDQRHNAEISVWPDTVTTYRLYADYSPEPRCPTITELTLEPLVLPEAKMRVTPLMLSPENLSFEARDISEEYAGRQWFINNELLDWTGRTIHSTAEPDADTVRVKLVVFDNQCTDTALALLPVQRSDLYIPNAFTPGADDNQTFYVQGLQIAFYEISIYNRRGVLVYHSNDIGAHWDGNNMAGEHCPSGNYIYHILYSTNYRPASKQKIVGQILLVR